MIIFDNSIWRPFTPYNMASEELRQEVGKLIIEFNKELIKLPTDQVKYNIQIKREITGIARRMIEKSYLAEGWKSVSCTTPLEGVTTLCLIV